MDGNVTGVVFAPKARHVYREGETLEGGSTNAHVKISLPAP